MKKIETNALATAMEATIMNAIVEATPYVDVQDAERAIDIIVWDIKGKMLGLIDFQLAHLWMESIIARGILDTMPQKERSALIHASSMLLEEEPGRRRKDLGAALEATPDNL